MRLRILIAYDGTAFHGWQIQPDEYTVEGDLTRALAQITRVQAKISSASRTDAGVHAEGQVAHFDYEGEMTPERLMRGLNAVVDRGIRVLLCEPVGPDFHARHSARGKLYRYGIWNHRFHHPLHRRVTTHVPYRLDLAAMARAATHFVGRHDFSALRSASCDARSPVLDLYGADVLGQPPLITVEVRGAAFLKYMVRTLVGTLVEVGRGKRDSDSIPDLLASADRAQAGDTAKARGLRLVSVRYPDFPWSNGEIEITSAL